MKFQDHDVKIVFGDLNFRINTSYTEGIIAAEDFEYEDQEFLRE
jgi:hypothetical protein